MSITIYHNPRCSKSREGLQILEKSGVSFDVRLYMKEHLNKREIQFILDSLQVSIQEVLRTKEKIYQDEVGSKNLSSDELINLVIKYPQLLERPIVVKDNKAVVGRPPEKIHDLI